MKKFRIRSNPKPSRPALGPRGRVRPALEILEDRTLLSFAGPFYLERERARMALKTGRPIWDTVGLSTSQREWRNSPASGHGHRTGPLSWRNSTFCAEFSFRLS